MERPRLVLVEFRGFQGYAWAAIAEDGKYFQAFDIYKCGHAFEPMTMHCCGCGLTKPELQDSDSVYWAIPGFEIPGTEDRLLAELPEGISQDALQYALDHSY